MQKNKKSFWKNFVSRNEQDVSSIYIGFWFFSLAAIYCLIAFQNIPDNLMYIVITLAVSHGAISFRDVGKITLGAPGKVLNAIQSGRGAGGIAEAIVESIPEENTAQSQELQDNNSSENPFK